MAYEKPLHAGDIPVTDPVASPGEADRKAMEMAKTLTSMGHGKTSGVYAARYGRGYSVFVHNRSAES